MGELSAGHFLDMDMELDLEMDWDAIRGDSGVDMVGKPGFFAQYRDFMGGGVWFLMGLTPTPCQL